MTSRRHSTAATALLVICLLQLYRMHLLFSPRLAGQILQGAAIAFMIWARWTFGVRSFHFAADPTPGALVTWGPYRLTRNPIYLSVLVFVWTGIATHHLSLLGLGYTAGATIATLIRIGAEERLLARHYPEYARYARETRRLVPYLLSALLLLPLAQTAGAQPGPDLLRPATSAPAIAFVDVSVIPMDRDRVLEHRTVLVREGRIQTIGSARSVVIPTDAQRISGVGKYLMPGLVDMHAHFYPGAGTMLDPAGQQLALFIGTGFTTVRGLGGSVATALALRDRIARGDLLGPRLVVASPSINGRSATSPADVARKVEEAKRVGYDLIKTHGMFPSSESYDSLVAATRRTDLPLSGHVTPEYGLARAMEAHQQIEHLDGYIAAILPDGMVAPEGQLIADAELLSRIDDAKLAALSRRTATLGIWNGPTMALFETIASDETPEQLARRPEMRFASAKAIQQFSQQKAEVLQNIPAEGRAAFIASRRRILRSLHAAGAKLLVGSDSPQFFMLPGYAALREIEAFVGAGLTPYAALEAATRNPAEYLGRSSDVSTVAVGKRADLILLDSNPLLNIAAIHELSGVMLGGRWLDSARLAELRDAVAGAAGAAH